MYSEFAKKAQGIYSSFQSFNLTTLTWSSVEVTATVTVPELIPGQTWSSVQQRMQPSERFPAIHQAQAVPCPSYFPPTLAGVAPHPPATAAPEPSALHSCSVVMGGSLVPDFTEFSLDLLTNPSALFNLMRPFPNITLIGVYATPTHPHALVIQGPPRGSRHCTHKILYPSILRGSRIYFAGGLDMNYTYDGTFSKLFTKTVCVMDVHDLVWEALGQVSSSGVLGSLEICEYYLAPQCLSPLFLFTIPSFIMTPCPAATAIAVGKFLVSAFGFQITSQLEVNAFDLESSEAMQLFSALPKATARQQGRTPFPLLPR